MQGMAVVGFAVIAGFGLTALCGIAFSPLAGSVVPFLALGLGKITCRRVHYIYFVHTTCDTLVFSGGLRVIHLSLEYSTKVFSTYVLHIFSE